jgi:hypothetical protein
VSHAWARYFVAYSFDTTVGVATAIALHWSIVTHCKRHKQGDRLDAARAILADCGNYGELSP